MLKKTMFVFALMALLVGTLLAQPMRVEGNDDYGYGRRGMMANNHKMMGDNDHHQAKRGMGMNHRKGDNKMKEMNSGRMVLAMSEELELTPAQINDIQEIQANFKKTLNTKQAEIKNLLIDKRDAMMKQNFKQASKVTKDIYNLKEEIALAKITVMEDIHKELSKAQIDLLKAKCKMK